MKTKTTANELIMLKDKDCKHSVRFAAPDGAKNPPLTSIYVNREYCEKNGIEEKIAVSLAAA